MVAALWAGIPVEFTQETGVASRRGRASLVLNYSATPKMIMKFFSKVLELLECRRRDP